MKTRDRRVWSFALVATLLCFGPAGAEEPRKEKPEDESQAQAKAESAPPESPYAQAARAAAARGPAPVFTNEDLKRLSKGETPDESKLSLPRAPTPEGESVTSPAAPDEPKEVYDPLKQLMDREERRKERQAEIAVAEQRLVDSKKRLAELEKRRLAVVNPYLARPEVSEKTRGDWAKMTPGERQAQTDKKIEQARAEIEEAARELDRLRRDPV